MPRKIAYSVALLAVAGAAYLAGSWHAPHETVNAAAGERARVVAYYRCPMHPAFKSDKPGVAPCCGMAYEPVYGEGDPAVGAHEQTGAVAVTSVQQQLIGVKVGPVEGTGGTERIRLYGRVAADETRIWKINVGLEGYIREISGVTTGTYVRKDQWLANFSTPEVRQPISGYIVALDALDREMKTGGSTPAQIAAARASLDLGIERLRGLGLSPLQLDEIRQTRQTSTTIKVASPVDGFVLARNVTAGQKVDRGIELFEIADLRRVWILADATPAEAARIAPGTTADVLVGGQRIPVRARASSAVLPQFDPATQSSKIRFEIDNPGFTFRPDMFVDVDLDVAYAAAISVPAEALVASGLRSTVFVERSPGVFEPRDVETGRRFGGRVAIVRGLEAGERIAVSGTFLLDSESRMKQR